MSPEPNLPFNLELAKACSHAFSISTGIGCTVSDTQGRTLCEQGYGCSSCELCGIAGEPQDTCVRIHNYGMDAASRFGGRYVYFCPMGLTCFVSPIIGDTANAARITAGPFIMVEKQDFIDCELSDRFSDSSHELKQALLFLEKVPTVTPEKVQELSVLLFMAAGFMNNLSEESRFMTMARSDSLQMEINAYILQMKQEASSFGYPFDQERSLLNSISEYDTEKSLRILKKLLAQLLINGGGNLKWIKTRLSELLVMISRTAIHCGAQEKEAMQLLMRFRKASPSLGSFDDLSAWLVKLLEDFLNGLRRYPEAKHSSSINSCIQYLNTHCSRPVSLQETAQYIGLSPSYLSRIFKAETGISFNQYLNQLRISRAKELLRHTELRLLDIASLTGFEDQSYFTKVFRRMTGISPLTYRQKAQIPASDQEEHI